MIEIKRDHSIEKMIDQESNLNSLKNKGKLINNYFDAYRDVLNKSKSKHDTTNIQNSCEKIKQVFNENEKANEKTNSSKRNQPRLIKTSEEKNLYNYNASS